MRLNQSGLKNYRWHTRKRIFKQQSDAKNMLKNERTLRKSEKCFKNDPALAIVAVDTAEKEPVKVRQLDS